LRSNIEDRVPQMATTPTALPHAQHPPTGRPLVDSPLGDVAEQSQPSGLRQLLALPILFKVLIANAAIVAFGAIGGTWLTLEAVNDLHGEERVSVVVAFVLGGVVLSVTVNYLVLRAAFQPVSNLERAATAVRSGDFSVRVAPTAFVDPQFAQFAATFNATLDEIARDREQLRALASQVIRAQEQERKRIARELHDDTAQVLFAQLLNVTALKASPSPEVRETAARLEEMTVEAIEGVRRMAVELRPPALDDLGLLAALGDLAQRFADQLGIPVDYQARGPRGRLPAEVELVLYRIAQEALTNVAKHAGARHVWIDLDRGLADVSLSVRDDGQGFDPATPRASDERGLGLGLFGMEERVALVGGSFKVWPRRGGGTEIFAFIPLASSAAQILAAPDPEESAVRVAR
jgi:two-component system sensor histidine kinase UhpB